MRRIPVSERRARLARRHHLAPDSRAATPLQVARDLVALHGTDPSSVYLATMARTITSDPAGLERALYDERSLVRMLGMRRTMFVVPVETAPVIQAACTRAIAVKQRRRYCRLVEEASITTDGAAWFQQVEAATLKELAARGDASAAELSAVVPELRRQMAVGEGKKWAGVQGVSTWVLFLMAADGHIVRARPRGSWTSSQYRWATVEHWLGQRLADLPVDPARADLAAMWLGSFGPGTAADLQWWSGWTGGETHQALARLATVEVEINGTTGLVLADDVAPVDPVEPWAALLPALDPTAMGWTERGWFLGKHRVPLFDRSGNIGPTVWYDGGVVGGWAQRKDGEIAVRLLEDIGAEGTGAVEQAAQRLQGAMGPVRVIPRFRTPLERELSA